MGSRLILHVDMNAFFASVEQRSNPCLRGRPLVVCGDPARRGIVLTASYEARPYGVKTGMLVREARALCPNLEVVAGDWDKYMESSREIFTQLTVFSPHVEMTSCDEAYVDVTDSGWAGAESLAHAVQSRLAETPGLPCSVGVAPNKLLAKLASEMKKPRGVTVVRPETVADLMARTPVEALCGIGGRMKRHLNALGIETCGQLGAAPFETLYTRFGVTGHWLKRMGQGLDDSPVQRLDADQAAKSMGHATTFPADISDPELVKGYLLHLCEKVGARLRKAGRAGREVSFTLRDARFFTVSRRLTLGEPVAEDEAVYGAALRIFTSFLPLRRAVRLVGVTVSGLEPRGGTPSLWPELERGRRAAEIQDRLNARYGPGTLTRARTLLARRRGLLAPPIPPVRVV
jgi:DNA polymerase-4